MTAAPQPLRVVVADDHPFYRRQLSRSIRASGIDVAAEVPNGEAAIRAVDETAPDVIVMDLKMPGLSGLEATRRLVARDAGTRVLVLSVSADEEDVTDAFLAGACGYVLKDRPVQEVVEGIRAAALGEARITPQLAMPLLRRLSEPDGVQVDLTGVSLELQERQVLDLLAAGTPDHEIAAALGITEAAVHQRASSILVKLRPENRMRAARRASRRDPV